MRELTKGIYTSDPARMYVLEIEIELDSLSEKINVKADTGFSAEVFLPESYARKFDRNNISWYRSDLILADGRVIPARMYPVDIKRIGKYRCDPFSAFVHCCGDGIPLIGLELLNRWVCEFDGPNNCLTLFG